MRPQFEKWNDKLSFAAWSKRTRKAEICLYHIPNNVIRMDVKIERWSVLKSKKFSPHGSCYLFHCCAALYILPVFPVVLCTSFLEAIWSDETARNRDKIKPITGWCFWPLAVCAMVITLQAFSVGQNDLFDVL